MGSLHLCKPATTMRRTESRLPTLAASTSNFTNLNISVNIQRRRFDSLALQHVSRRDSCVTCSVCTTQESPLRIGIVGLGAFGQFLAKAFQRQGHTVLATSRSDYSEYCEEHGIEFFRELDGLCEAQPDVLLICSSILSTENVVCGIPFHKLKSDTIIADVLSVKLFPKNLFLDIVPSGFGILCTHPMFGKYSGTNIWEGLRFVYDKVRITENSIQEKKCGRFLSIFQDEGCKMVNMYCEEHDRYAAESQFVTHTVANVLSNMNLEATPIDTKGYETLRELAQNTVSHGSDLFDGQFLYNVNSINQQIKKLEESFDSLKKDLFKKLRIAYGRQIEETASAIDEELTSTPSLESVCTNARVPEHGYSSFSVVPKERGSNG